MNIFSNEKIKQEIMANREERKVPREASRMISKIFLDSDAPDHIKLSIRGLDKAVDVKVALDELVEKYLSKMDGRMANAETLETVLSYLELVEAGIKQFTQDTPFVEHVSEVTDDE